MLPDESSAPTDLTDGESWTPVQAPLQQSVATHVTGNSPEKWYEARTLAS